MIHLRDVRISFPNFQLEVIDETLSESITGIFGPSGAGKTTLLEILAGIRRPHSAFIECNGVILTDTTHHIHVPIERREFGYVPQDLALFPHLSVRQNLLFGVHGKLIDKQFGHIVDILEINGLLSRGIANLSGGEKQRIAFARALLASPRLLMLDEPLANLDQALKKRMLQYLLDLTRDLKIPMIYVSHESEEITQLCTDVLIIQSGHIVNRGAPCAIL